MATESGNDRDIEFEFKQRVADESVFHAIAKETAFTLGPPVRQTNYFFDTVDGDLDQQRYSLRLRDDGGEFKLTAKRDASKTAGSASQRDEAEETIESELAEEILAGVRVPFDLLESTHAPSSFLQDMKSLLAGKPQSLIGSFENERTICGPVKLGEGDRSIELTLEMDRTIFPGDLVQYEIEVEVSKDQARLAEQQLSVLWKDVGLRWSDEKIPSKFARFKSSLAGRTVD